MATATKKQTTTPAAAAPTVAAPKQKKPPKTPVEQLIFDRSKQATAARFVFYPGQKGTIIERIAGLIPRGATRLIEPFTGSASVPAALAFRFKEIRCSDAMPAVIAAHNRAINNPDGFCADIQALFDEPTTDPEQRFYDLRENYYNNPSTPLHEKAAILIYLNRKAAMGLVRHNEEGGFSAPWHESKMGNPPPLARIREFSKRLKGKATFMLRDFRKALKEAKAGDFVYCDPPYLPEGEKKTTFTGYSDKFGAKDQKHLALLAEAAASRGAKVVISNHDSPKVRALYASATSIIALDVERKAGRKKGEKAKTTAAEVLAVWNPRRPTRNTPPPPWPVASLDTPSPYMVMPLYHKTVVKRLRWESAIDPYNRDADLAALDRRVYETAAANGWLEPTATPANIIFRSFKDSGRYLLKIARHGTPAMRRLVLHRPGREHHLSLHLLATMADDLRKGVITFGKAERNAQKLLTLADGLEETLKGLPNAEKLLVRILKTKAEVVVAGKLNLGELPKRYAAALTTLNARGWGPGSEEGNRLLLLAEMTCDADTRDFGTLCKALAKDVSVNLFVNIVPPEKIGSGKGVPLATHIARPAGCINKIRDDLKAAMPKPKKPAKKPAKAPAPP